MTRKISMLRLGAFVGALIVPALVAAQVMTFEPTEDPGAGDDTMTFGTGP